MGVTPVNDHQCYGVTRVWLALALLCRVAASFNKALKSDCKPMAVLVQLVSVVTVVIWGLVMFTAT
jgi:hypothetical protein